MILLFDSFAENSLNIDFLQPGRFQAFVNGLAHTKTLPCTVIAQALDGEYEISVEGSTPERTGKGGLFIVEAGRSMTIVHHGPGRKRPMKAQWAHVRWSLFQTVDVSTFMELPRVLRPREAKAFTSLLSAMQDPVLSASPAPLAALARRRELGFALLGRLCAVSRPRAGSLERFRLLQRLAPALRHLRENIHRPPRVAELAKRVCLSVPRFHALFHEAFSIPPARYLQDLRFNDARYRLLATDLNLAEIAGAVGFSDAFHFSRFFKSKAGLSPSEYRKRHEDLTV